MAHEIDELSPQIEALKKALSEARRRSAEPVADYELLDRDGNLVQLSALFGEEDDLIVVHNMGRGRAYCAMWADGFTGFLPHLEDRAAFVVVSPDDPETSSNFADGRGWRFRILSSKGTSFTRDLGFQTEADGYWPGFSAFRRQPDGSIVRVGRDFFGPGDDDCSPWRMLHVRPAQRVRGESEPRYKYEPAIVSS